MKASRQRSCLTVLVGSLAIFEAKGWELTFVFDYGRADGGDARLNNTHRATRIHWLATILPSMVAIAALTRACERFGDKFPSLTGLLVGRIARFQANVRLTSVTESSARAVSTTSTSAPSGAGLHISN